MSYDLYEEQGYVPESPIQLMQVGESSVNVSPILVAGTVDASFADSESSFYDPVSLPPVTPPKKSILRPMSQLVLTPNPERKRVRFTRKSESWNITPACSPAYNDRDSIPKSDMANVTFCLDRTSSKNNSPAVAQGPARPSLSNQIGLASSSTVDNGPSTFQLSTYISMLSLSSPIKKSFSSSHINRIGSHSTPTVSVDSQSNFNTPNGYSTQVFYASPQVSSQTQEQR